MMIIIGIIVFVVFSLLITYDDGTDPATRTGAYPPDMYDPTYDYNHDGVQDMQEKLDQFVDWEKDHKLDEWE